MLALFAGGGGKCGIHHISPGREILPERETFAPGAPILGHCFLARNDEANGPPKERAQDLAGHAPPQEQGASFGSEFHIALPLGHGCGDQRTGSAALLR
ncbi:hypothetical protein NT2_12_00400 [Caenibius tardaugens NBRC 16725]|uniref:Uncharacterized protein n=1 Tax=Caenibius tardaugens NBRC 16725 TaxID=1219035 RepID=U2YBD0_9SPHN|nr:hypothetical protein NT2_12_00400 [Caenibius tardaugens NBRC 16725]